MEFGLKDRMYPGSFRCGSVWADSASQGFAIDHAKFFKVIQDFPGQVIDVVLFSFGNEVAYT
jgi:hypothetical protein